MDLTVLFGSSPWQQTHAKALADGADRCGVKVLRQVRGTTVRTKAVACWSWHIGKGLRESGKDVLVMERGYLGDRFAWTSLGWNGLNNRAQWPVIDDVSRFKTHFSHLMKPWKTGGDYVLLIGQVPHDASIRGVNIAQWYLETAAAAKRAYGLPVLFRQHPEALKRGLRQSVPGTAEINGTLDDALAGAAVCIVYNSNVGVDAVMAGCPVVAMDKGTMAYPVSGTKIGDLYKPERDLWAARLAWCQFELSEISSGLAWSIVGRVLQKEAA